MRLHLMVPLCFIGAIAPLHAQDEPIATPRAPAPAQVPPTQQPNGLKTRPDTQVPGVFTVPPGTRILLSMINSVSTKQAQVGDRIYLETAFPVLSGSKIVIPQGSWVTGTVMLVKRPGRVAGKGALQVRFDSLTLPNGVNRDFRADLGAIDARDDQTLKREDSKITGPGDKKGDVGTVIGATTAGTVIGSGVGAAAGNAARGAGMGAGIGAAAGLLGVLLTRGPDATLSKGATVEMVLDRTLSYEPSDLDFSNAPPRATISEGGNRTAQPQRRGVIPGVPFP
ncbi:MAG: TrbI/VirB10 family protein [Acidobacteriaceae bacterium]|nr:TrbI/VirB10 family protein [Acidobacteriaceae bacterium]